MYIFIGLNLRHVMNFYSLSISSLIVLILRRLNWHLVLFIGLFLSELVNFVFCSEIP